MRWPGPSKPPSRGRLLFLFAVAVAIGVELLMLFRPTSTVGAAGLRPYDIESFSAAEPVGQTFRILDDGLELVDLELSSTEPAVLDLGWRLLGGSRDTMKGWSVVYSGERRIDLPRGRSWHRFRFNPIFPSEKRIYRFQVERRGLRPANPHGAEAVVAGIMASRDDSLAGGNIVIGGRQLVDRDLFFAAQTATPFTRFRVHANPLLPRPFRSVVIQLTLLAVGTWMLAAFAFEMIVRGPGRDEG